MTWTGIDGARFIRPIRWIVAVVNGKPLKFSFAGVTAGDTTLGHRFLGKGPLRVKNFADYEKKLQNQWRHRSARGAGREDFERA